MKSPPTPPDDADLASPLLAEGENVSSFLAASAYLWGLVYCSVLGLLIVAGVCPGAKNVPIAFDFLNNKGQSVEALTAFSNLWSTVLLFFAKYLFKRARVTDRCIAIKVRIAGGPPAVSVLAGPETNSAPRPHPRLAPPTLLVVVADAAAAQSDEEAGASRVPRGPRNENGRAPKDSHLGSAAIFGAWRVAHALVVAWGVGQFCCRPWLRGSQL